MKLSAIAFAALLTISGLASAKTSYVTGDIQSLDRENLAISIVKDSGSVEEYKIQAKAVKKMKGYKVGDSVTLTLKTTKVER